jgi:peptidoglycan/xylan/chitin deacetylase (PgdA/CDA1 family)
MSSGMILMYHIVDEPLTASEARYCVAPTSFRAQMRHLSLSGRIVVPLLTLVDALRSGNAVQEGTVAITFDDGFECFQRNALPVLAEFRFPATLFAIAGKLGQTNTWMQAKGWPARKLTDRQALRETQKTRIAIGCHSLHHKPMTQLTDDELIAETVDARSVLSDALGSDVTLFAYPHGDQGERERKAVARAGYAAACSTEPGFNERDVDLYALRRIDIFGSDTTTHFRRKLAFGANRVSNMQLAQYYFGRLAARVHA